MSDDEDNQGFISNPIQIESKNINTKVQANKSHIAKEYQARYINGYGIIKKEAKESYFVADDIKNRQKMNIIRDEEQVQVQGDIIENNKTKNNMSEQQSTNRQSFSQNYFNNVDKYTLIYNRNGSNSSKQGFSFQNQIKLKNYQALDKQQAKSQKYHKLRQFQNVNQSSSNADLIFDSAFEGGNLLYAYKNNKEKNSYTLFMQNDTNTYGYNQWFYFSLGNVKKNIKYQFKIVNFKKKYSLFEMGFKPAIFSLRKAQEEGSGWYRDGLQIKYYKSSLSTEEITYYTLEFSLVFDHDNDYITISPSLPYSYSKLIDFLSQAQTQLKSHDIFFKIESIGTSLAGNHIPFLSITKSIQNIDKKGNIIIMARQHSGQTWSSFLMQHIIRQIMENFNSQHNQYLLNNFVLRIFPMINVDGVIYGNFRCDLAGYDLNRCWKNPIPIIHDGVINIKNQIERLKKNGGIQLFLDLHTHSRELGAFVYCSSENQKAKELPFVFSKICPIFRYKACTYGITNDKRNTARAFVSKLSKNTNIMTMQLSAFGFKIDNNSPPVQFSPLYIKKIAQMITYGFFCHKKSIDPVTKTFQIDNKVVRMQKIQKQTDFCDVPVDGSDSQPDLDMIQDKIKLKSIFSKQICDIFEKINNKSKSKKLILDTNMMNKAKHLTNIGQKRFLKTKSILKSFHPQKLQVQTNRNLQENDITFNKMISLHSKTTDLLGLQQKKRINNKRTIKSYEKNSENSNKKQFISTKINKLKPTLPLSSVQFSLSDPRIPNLPSSNQKIEDQIEYFPFVAVKSYSKTINRDQNLSSIEKADKQSSNHFSTISQARQQKTKLTSYIKKHELIREKERLQQQLPYLLILSDKKKQKYYSKFKAEYQTQRQEEENLTKKGMIKEFITFNGNKIIKNKSNQKTFYRKFSSSRTHEQSASIQRINNKY